MNNFTKDELIYLEMILHQRILKECRPRVELDIRNKIRSLLNNYGDDTQQYENFDYQPIPCQKCKSIIGD